MRLRIRSFGPLGQMTTDGLTALARKLLQGSRRCPAREGGFTIVEVLVAASVLLVGIMSTMGVFTSSKRATASAHRHDVALNMAEKALDEMRKLDYEELRLTDFSTNLAAPPTNDWRHPLTNNQRILRIRSGSPGYYEATVLPDAAAEFNPAQTLEIGGVTGDIYRYVTWREDGCTAALCVGQDTKRISIAVTIDSVPGGAAPRPVWVSSIVNDPGAGAAEELSGAAGSDAGLIAERFYLHDNSCQYTTPSAAVLDHPTANTAAQDGVPGAVEGWDRNSRCNYAQSTGNPIARTEPDQLLTDQPLMGPSDPQLDPLPKYSADTEDYGGLRMRRQGAHSGSCGSAPTDYTWPEGDAGGANKRNVHRWSTNELTRDFTLDRRVALTLYTRTLSGASLGGSICVTLIERFEGPLSACPTSPCTVPTENVLARFAIERQSWNAPGKWAAFSRQWLLDANGDGIADPVTVRQESRLVLAISMHADSQDNLVFAYGHPAYPTHLTIETTAEAATQ